MQGRWTLNEDDSLDELYKGKSPSLLPCSFFLSFLHMLSISLFRMARLLLQPRQEERRHPPSFQRLAPPQAVRSPLPFRASRWFGLVPPHALLLTMVARDKKEEELARTRGDLLETQEQLAKARMDLLRARHHLVDGQRQPTTAGAGGSRGLAGNYLLRGADGEESPLRSQSHGPMAITEVPPYRGDDQLAAAKRRRGAEESQAQGEASFRPTLCEACNVMMNTKQVMKDHFGGRKHCRAMKRLLELEGLDRRS
ncbi:hypothetical protein SETIT_2G048500v2 [Setaria italica]|uniref:U1-type domain-containing protein n=1 Tax=Setaria italica TaxID=4555 RepID=A0A368PVL3_SETIT|nr:hypothetical protein SETIT_2G048500v2 [Setaria italica]